MIQKFTTDSWLSTNKNMSQPSISFLNVRNFAQNFLILPEILVWKCWQLKSNTLFTITCFKIHGWSLRHTVPHPSRNKKQPLGFSHHIEHRLFPQGPCLYPGPVSFNCEERLFLGFLPSLAGSFQLLQYPSNYFSSLKELEGSGRDLKKDKTKQLLLLCII